MAIELASKGYVVIAIGYRLADVAKYPAGVEDIERGIQWLQKNHQKYSLDKKENRGFGRICRSSDCDFSRC
ncbi:alpha/beta hydrolase fold domain-containing protein [Chryseobacterium wanjuense]